jgi:hypothetical protein
MKLVPIVVATLFGVTFIPITESQPVRQSEVMGPESKFAPMRWNNSNTNGWTLMTADERQANQIKMRTATTYDECLTLLDENHQTMRARAKAKGVTLKTPRQNGCYVLQVRGTIN